MCREVLLDALLPLGSPGHGIAKSEGAIYLWAKLPKGVLVMASIRLLRILNVLLLSNN